MRVRALRACVAACAVSACAGQGAPPGGPEDRRPPVVVRTEPEAFARVGSWDGAVRFHFDERISERAGAGELARSVVVSPRTGTVSVDHGRRDVAVRVEGGFRPGMVYRVTLLPEVSDLFGNQLREAFELVFSTGAEMDPTAVAGVVWDRLTGEAVAGAEVRAATATSLAPHVARTDERGIYALRYLSPAPYRLDVFDDVNLNGEIDFIERQGGAEVTVAEADTLLVDLPVLQPDSSSARLGGLSVLDSITLVVELDDYLDPAAPTTDVAVLVERDEGSAPAVERVFHEHAYVLYVQEAADSLARLDSVAAAARPPAPPVDSAAAPPDSLATPDTAVVPDTLAAADTTAALAPPPVPRRRGPTPLPTGGARGGRGAGAGAVSAERGPLPSRRLVVRLASPLERDVLYRVIVTGVVNVNLLPEGGGIDTVRFAPPDTAAAGAGRGGR